MSEQPLRNRVLSASEQLARDGIVTEVPGFSPEATSAESTDDSAENGETGVGRVLSVGDRVIVLRNPKEGETKKRLDLSDWRVIKTNPEVTTVQRVTAEDVSTKSFNTAELTALQERLDEEVRRQIGEEAVEKSGIKQPEASIPESAQPVKPEIEVSAQETKREMLDRHVREYQVELSGLYKEHRGVDPKSARAGQLENLIKQKKEDIGRVDKQRRNL